MTAEAEITRQRYLALLRRRDRANGFEPVSAEPWFRPSFVTFALAVGGLVAAAVAGFARGAFE